MQVPSGGIAAHFNWQVSFNTTGRNGWIVQEVANTERAEDAEGLDVIEEPASPHYWEAWAVDSAGDVTPANGVDNDYWTNPPYVRQSWALVDHRLALFHHHESGHPGLHPQESAYERR